MVRFITIFPECQNIQLVKDVGMIPYLLHKKEGYDSTIASYKNGDYPYLETEVKGLRHIIIKRKFKSTRLNVLLFIMKNFKKYDVLQVYHFSIDSLLFLSFFKMLKLFDNRTRTYLKLDADDDILKIRLVGVFGTLGKIMINKISLITIETKILYDKLQLEKKMGNCLFYIPNGFYDYDKRKKICYNKKRNEIITVGRIGTYQKNNEILLEAFKLFAINDKLWNLNLVGPIEDEFQYYIKKYFEENPELRDRVNFTGSVSDRKKLDKIYEEAKIFVLTSRYEGFPLVFLEAIKAGCTIISSDFTASYDVIQKNRYGRIFSKNDVNALKNYFNELCENETYLENNCYEIQHFAYDNFFWTKLVNQIHTNLKVNDM